MTEATTARFAVRGQYIKDLSFENPRAPQSLLAPRDTPQMEVNVNLTVQKVQEALYELTMMLSVKAKADGEVLFLCELSYAAIFELSGIPEERIEAAMLVDAPFIIFPFARRVIADVTRDGGFPPLLLDPIDFRALFLQNQKKTAN